MDAASRRALGLLAQNSRSMRASGRVRLKAAYLRAVRSLESLPENQSGADKAEVLAVARAWSEHFAQRRG